jgi:hypothetical protein
MANTHTLLIQGKAFSVGGVMAGVFNGGARVLRLRRVFMANVQTAVVTGVLCAGRLIFRSATAVWTTPTSVASVPHDTGNSALDTVTTGHAGTPSGGTAFDFGRYAWSSDEPAVSGATMDELECLVPLGLIWDAGYGDANVQPLSIRQNEFIYILNDTGAAGLVDIRMEFTDEAT